jgi:hypothetical protein
MENKSENSKFEKLSIKITIKEVKQKLDYFIKLGHKALHMRLKLQTTKENRDLTAFVIFYFIILVLGTEHRALSMLSTHSTTELHTQSKMHSF